MVEMVEVSPVPGRLHNVPMYQDLLRLGPDGAVVGYYTVAVAMQRWETARWRTQEHGDVVVRVR